MSSRPVLPAVLQTTTGFAVAWLALGVAGVLVLSYGRYRVRGTTLMAPLGWTLFSLVMLVGGELLLVLFGAGEAGWTGPLRFAVAMTTFCPLMAVLGAKRPQDRGWQFIVLSLWLLLMVPSGQAVLFQPGEPLELFPAWSWFLTVLLLMSLANYLPTRHWMSSLMVFAGQAWLVGEHLPMARFEVGELGRLGAVALMLGGAALAALGLPARRRGRTPIDGVWIDFRDWFGAVWGLRVAERLRTNSSMYGWGVAPTWSGFVMIDEKQMPQQTEEELLRSLRTLLRRFVSPQWIAERLQNP